MIIVNAAILPTADASTFAWSGLRRFHHIPSTTDTLLQLHHAPEKQRGNVQKQAEQLRQCLIQAREYRDAAEATSLATKPVLLYYSLMSLALAQILFQGTGKDSLDASRDEHKHHGLILKTLPREHKSYDLVETAGSLVAKPMISGHHRRGSFELWHRLSREDPIAGEDQYQVGGGILQHTANLLLFGDDAKIGYLHEEGISLFDCFQGTPGMLGWLHANCQVSRIVRGRARRHQTSSTSFFTELTIHAGLGNEIESLLKLFRFSPEVVNTMNVIEVGSGVIARIDQQIGERCNFHFPPSANWNNQELRFLPSGTTLNEFGYFYIGLYILGNYARYFPDRWMKDVDGGTPLAVATEEFLSLAEWRMALLTYSVLSRTYWVMQA